jgi:hypothetical protein
MRNYGLWMVVGKYSRGLEGSFVSCGRRDYEQTDVRLQCSSDHSVATLSP